MLHSVDHPLAFSPTYFSPNLQSLANSPAANVPIDTVTVLVPLNPLEVDHMVISRLAAPRDLTLSEKIDMQNEKENQIIPEKSSSDTTGYLGPYRSDPNFTRGKKLSNTTARSRTHMNPIHTSIQNDQIVVAKKKVTKWVDHSQRRQVGSGLAWSKGVQKKSTKEHGKKNVEEETKRQKYRPGTLALCEIRKYQRGTELLI